MTKHRKPSQESAGGIEKIPAPIHISNLMLVDPKTGDPTRVGRRKENDGKLYVIRKNQGKSLSNELYTKIREKYTKGSCSCIDGTISV